METAYSLLLTPYSLLYKMEVRSPFGFVAFIALLRCSVIWWDMSASGRGQGFESPRSCLWGWA